YGNSETDELFLYSEAGWEDYSTQHGVEELIYGTYSKTHEIIEQMPDSLQVMEEGDYDILYYTGDDDIVHQLYQDTFQVEFTGRTWINLNWASWHSSTKSPETWRAQTC